MVRLSENPEYGFAVGRVRALEPALLDRGRYERLVRAKGGDGFVAVLAETAYSKFLQTGAADVPRALTRAAEENFAFLAEYALDPWLLELARVPAAFLASKVELKRSRSSGAEGAGGRKEPAAQPGSLTAARASEARALALAAFEQGRDPSAIDLVMDRAQQSLALELARPNEFLTGYYRLHADLENLRTLARVKAGAGAGADLEPAFLPGGTLALSDFLAVLGEPWDVMVDRFAKAPPFGSGEERFFDYLEQGTTMVADRRSIVRMERLGRELELGYLRLTRYATFGLEPLATFFLLHENELRNLRQVHAAKVAGLPDETAQELVAWVE